MSLLDEAREAYDRRNLEACWKLVPALIVEIDLLTAETWDLGSEIEEGLQPEIGRLRAEIKRLERENAELRANSTKR